MPTNRKRGRGPSPKRAPPHTPPSPLTATLSPNPTSSTPAPPPPPPPAAAHPDPAPPPAAPPPLRRSSRTRAPTRPRPQPAADAIILYTIGNIPQRDRHELQAALDAFHANRYLQDQCRLILEDAQRYLIPEHVDGQGAGYKARQDIPAGTRLAVYSGQISRFGTDPGNHFLSLADLGFGYPLVADGTPPADAASAPVPVGQMQMLNHACPPFANCASDELVCDDTGLPLSFVYAIHPIAAGTSVRFSYQSRVTSSSFWRDESTLGTPLRGYETLRCGCAKPRRCPNKYARHERRARAPLPAPAPPLPPLLPTPAPTTQLPLHPRTPAPVPVPSHPPHQPGPPHPPSPHPHHHIAWSTHVGLAG